MKNKEQIDEVINTLVDLVNEGIINAVTMEHILYKVRAKTENDSYFATWHDNHLQKK